MTPAAWWEILLTKIRRPEVEQEAVREWLGYFPPRVNLYDAHFSYNWLDETLDRVRTELTSGSAEPWVHISNLDAELGDAHEREVVASLMERLLTEEVNGARLRLVVTSSVDPVFHFDSVLSDERRKIYEHPLPEPELQRLARILHNFRKAQVSRFAEPRSKPG